MASKVRTRGTIFGSMKVTAPTAGYTAGQMTAVGSVIGIIVEVAALGVETELIFSCERIVVPKRAGTGITFTAGDKVYYRSASAAVTNASTSNTLCGRALEDAGASDTTVEIVLNGDVVA
jgi:predicted RecA/RadA family phage recombinase